MGDRFSLNDKVIVVTGATGVLGHAFITALADEGAIVGIMGRNEIIANERADEIIRRGGRAIVLLADVTKEEQLIAARKKMLDNFEKIDGLVNAAGGNMPGAVINPDKNIFQLDFVALKQVMELNLFSKFKKTIPQNL